MDKACPYCVGSGYFQLITGGSETCPSCAGSGKDPNEGTGKSTEFEEVIK